LDVKAFIRELLFGHDCVIIPGFGGFIGNFFPASIDKNTRTFYPPARKISFNKNLNHNDGLLISKISQVTGINYGDARHIVEEFVRDLNNRLARGEKVAFDHLGTFINNKENNAQFEPEPNINYHLDSFGLESFQCLPLKEYDVRKRVIRHSDIGPVRHSSTRINLWRAAIVIPVLALLVAIPLKTDLFKMKVESSALNPLVTAEFENNRKAVDEAAIRIPDSSFLAKPPETVPDEPVSAKPPEEHYYCVITGSFKSEGNAISHVKKLRAEGFEPEINKAGNGFFRVTAIKCDDIETALSKKDSIAGKFPGTWISKR
jgi:nucleoid DNA-binding protein